MAWNMYKDGTARYDMRLKFQLRLEDIAMIIATVSTIDGRRIIITDDWDEEEGRYKIIKRDWTKREIDEFIRDRLQSDGTNTFYDWDERIYDYDGLYEKGLIESEDELINKTLESCKRVVSEVYNIDELRKKHGFEPKFKSKGIGKGWRGEPDRHKLARLGVKTGRRR